MIKVFTDGGSRGNPGPAALGVYIESGKGDILAQIGKRIGEATNNVAEYRAVLEALDWLVKNARDEEIFFYLDSELVCRQLLGIYKVKNQSLAKILGQIRDKEKSINLAIHYTHIPREKNKKADFLVNAALDNTI